MAIKFLRRVWKRHSKLGRGRKKKQVWRKPTGRDNKMRERKKGHPSVVSIGYRSEKKSRSLLKNKSPILVKNLKDLEGVKEYQIIILGKIGRKKKIEIAKVAKDKKIQIYNLNPVSYMKKMGKKLKQNKPVTEEKK